MRSFFEKELPAINHSFGQWYVETSATCTEAGQLRRDCTNCGDYENTALSATGHSYEAIVTEPTWDAGGYTTFTCKVCGSSYIGNHTEPLPYISGDVDNNGEVNTDDAIYLLYNVMFGSEDYPVNQYCDFDGNGTVNTDDAIYLLYHVMFGGEDYPLN